mmetsp:Transcript_14610/g.39117  ORF Transcript_14610/g.39117 Transcript_14610/m.39117 type:complete len:137 (+) Transcript_14610:164-574(+)
MTISLALVILSPEDSPVFETCYPELQVASNELTLVQLVMNAALDMVDEVMWSSRDMYLRVVDRLDDKVVSAFVTSGNYRFLLVHQSRHEDGVKGFFFELYDLFIKVVLNPMYSSAEPLQSPTFTAKVSALIRKHLL